MIGAFSLRFLDWVPARREALVSVTLVAVTATLLGPSIAATFQVDSTLAAGANIIVAALVVTLPAGLAMLILDRSRRSDAEPATSPPD